jgi:hypothetical protein
MIEQRVVVLGVVADVRQQHQVEPTRITLQSPIQLLLPMLLTRELERVPRGKGKGLWRPVGKRDLATEQ